MRGGKKKIRQFENREKMLRQKLFKEERRTRSHRLIVRGAVFESIVPEAKGMTNGICHLSPASLPCLFLLFSSVKFKFSCYTNWELFISFFSVLGLAIHHTLHETSLSKIPYYQPHLPTTSLLFPHRVIHTELSAYN